MTHIAIHDALNAIEERSEPYAFSAPRAVPGASPEAAVATAAHDVLVPLIFQFVPAWGDVSPFALRDASQFRPGEPYPLTSQAYADDLNEVRSVGDTISTTRTADQTEIAQFWYESSPLAWNRIARTVSSMTPGLTMWDQARLFGLLNMVMADGYIASFDAKRHYNTWRPITAIRAADTDGNPATDADPSWAPSWTRHPSHPTTPATPRRAAPLPAS